MGMIEAESKFVIIGAAVASIALYIVAKKAAETAGQLADKVVEVADNLNPLNADNYVNQGIDNIYLSLEGDTGINSTKPDPLAGNIKRPINVPGTPGYDNTKITTNAGGYQMNALDAAFARFSTFKWPWES